MKNYNRKVLLFIKKDLKKYYGSDIENQFFTKI